ncbi:hypothetical protein WH47_12600 [Habropoda laboriosa]|uniref:Uncharacterized protein n=1 Tax=Habropoda laboriosa TaxID=597456 RepID=A0A0L7R7P2_9HYME|nr:hypothetical protein WH47_12600 [Habropoda laboriosa]
MIVVFVLQFARPAVYASSNFYVSCLFLGFLLVAQWQFTVQLMRGLVQFNCNFLCSEFLQAQLV